MEKNGLLNSKPVFRANLVVAAPASIVPVSATAIVVVYGAVMLVAAALGKMAAFMIVVRAGEKVPVNMSSGVRSTRFARYVARAGFGRRVDGVFVHVRAGISKNIHRTNEQSHRHKAFCGQQHENYLLKGFNTVGRPIAFRGVFSTLKTVSRRVNIVLTERRARVGEGAKSELN